MQAGSLERGGHCLAWAQRAVDDISMQRQGGKAERGFAFVAEGWEN